MLFSGDDRIKNKDGTTSLALVLSYCPLGTLQEYLKGNTVDLMTFTNMALSISSALAFLHTEMHKQGERPEIFGIQGHSKTTSLIN